MTHYSIPLHLLLCFMISITIFSILLFNWMKKLKKGKFNLFWICLLTFFFIYSIFIGVSIYNDISIQVELYRFDINQNGIFEKEEINREQAIAFQKMVNDVGRNFSFITGIIFSFIISVSLFILGIIIKGISNSCRYRLK